MNIGNISVCVACYPPHIDCLKNLLHSINHQTLKPRECIIGLSEMNDDNKNILEQELNAMGFQFPIVISNKDAVCYQAENRNRAIAKATSKYITICDADDVIHKKRLEIVYQQMEKHNCHALVHSFTNNISNTDYNWALNKNPRIVLGEALYDAMKKTEGRQLHLPDALWIHHAYITFHKDVFQHIQQDTNLAGFRYGRCLSVSDVKKLTGRFVRQEGEDSKFVRDIIKFFGKNNKTMVFVDLPLVLYNS